jgi:hypothetical protein
MTTDNNGNVDGFGYSRGFGYNASSAGTMNGNYSIRSWSCGTRMNIHFSTCAFDIRNRSSLPRKITRYLTKTDTFSF